MVAITSLESVVVETEQPLNEKILKTQFGKKSHTLREIIIISLINLVQFFVVDLKSFYSLKVWKNVFEAFFLQQQQY